MRDSEEIRLNYCKKCGYDLDNHDNLFCENNKYPALITEFGFLFPIATLYKIDLITANSNQADNGRHGSVMGDIGLDVCGLIHNWMNPEQDTKSDYYTKNFIFMKSFIKDGLKNQNYSEKEIDDFINSNCILGTDFHPGFL